MPGPDGGVRWIECEGCLAWQHLACTGLGAPPAAGGPIPLRGLRAGGAGNNLLLYFRPYFTNEKCYYVTFYHTKLSS